MGIYYLNISESFILRARNLWFNAVMCQLVEIKRIIIIFFFADHCVGWHFLSHSSEQMKTENHTASSKTHPPHGVSGRVFNGGTMDVAYSNGSVKRKSLPTHSHAPPSGHHHHASNNNAHMRVEGAVPSHHLTGSSSSHQRGPPPPYPHGGRVSLPPGYAMPHDHVSTAGVGVESAAPPSVSLSNCVPGQYSGKGHHYELPSSGHRGASTVHNYPYSHPPG